MESDRPDYSDIGDRIIAFREYLKMSPAEFADSHGYSRSALSNWEAGIRRISIDAATRLYEQYGLSLDFIYLGRLSALPHNLAKALSGSPLESAESKSSD